MQEGSRITRVTLLLMTLAPYAGARLDIPEPLTGIFGCPIRTTCDPLRNAVDLPASGTVNLIREFGNREILNSYAA
jgi:hypothetical protein